MAGRRPAGHRERKDAQPCPQCTVDAHGDTWFCDDCYATIVPRGLERNVCDGCGIEFIDMFIAQRWCPWCVADAHALIEADAHAAHRA